MAKISANGAHEVARIKATFSGNHTRIFVITSDGRVLGRWTGDLNSGYVVILRNIPPECRNSDNLRHYVKILGYAVRGS